MTNLVVVSNTSPVIALAQIGQLDLLQQLFPVTVIPPAVRREITSVPVPGWIAERAPTRPLNPRLGAALDLGEREAIGLASEIGAAYVLLDDLPARAVAEGLRLSVLGTLGILLLAKQRGLISAIRPHLDALRAVNFFMGERLYQRLLVLAGED